MSKLEALKRHTLMAWRWVKWGRLTAKVTDSINGIACEESYTDRFGREVGFWAYGHWHPGLPYQGDDAYMAKASA
jgi:hypothetical protein